MSNVMLAGSQRVIWSNLCPLRY